MLGDLRDKSIVITGAGTGIGAATAVACAQAGMHVVLNGRRQDKLAAVAELVEAAGRHAAIVTGDVTDLDASARLLDAADRAFGAADAVFANAGYSLGKTVLDESPGELRQIFDVNFFACVDLLRAAATRLLERERPGHLLMCSSCVSKFTLPRSGSYAATKAAQNSICAAMRLELRKTDVSVSSVHPITTTTEFFETSARLRDCQPPPSGTPDHSPGMFTQPPERVARAIVRCLRTPRPEVWTSHIVRGTAAAMTMFPRFGDWIISRRAAKD